MQSPPQASDAMASPGPTDDPSDLRKVSLFDLNIAAVTYEEAVQALADAAVRRDARARIVVTPNVDHVTRLDRTPEFRRQYAQADFIFADGMPVIWASRILNRPLPQRVTGADLFVSMCQQAQEKGWRAMLLGGMPGTEADLQERFKQYYPRLNIDIVAPSMKFDPTGAEGEAFAQQVRAIAPDIIFVCVGMPKQEKWAFHFAPSLPGGIILCVGAAMEFAIGLQRRAPMFFQRAGLEWLWRLATNPTRLWRRYLVEDPRFVILCWRQWRRQRREDGAAP